MYLRVIPGPIPGSPPRDVNTNIVLSDSTAAAVDGQDAANHLILQVSNQKYDPSSSGIATDQCL